MCASLRVVALVLVLPALATQASAQTIPITGVVRDPSGAAVAGATVTADVGGRASATHATDAEGRYRVDVPARVPVTLTVEAPGFASALLPIEGVSAPLARDIVLEIGGVSDTLVVTAARGREGRVSLTESVTAFSRAEMAALGSTSLADVMRFVPGVALAGAGREGALTAMFSRGGESDYNLVLIDGVRVNASGGTFDLGRVTAAEIDRVEVVRGAQSSLWGSDAMGAVVQIFTRQPASAVQISGTLERGSFGSLRGDARVSGGARRRLDYQLGITRRSTAGAFGEILPEPDRFAQTTADGNAGGTLTPRLTVRGGFRYSTAAGRNVGPLAFGSRDTGGVYDTQDLSLYATATHLAGTRFTGVLTFNGFRSEGRSADVAADAPFTTYALLTGTPNALFPDGTRLVRLLDRAEFDRLSTSPDLASGQFLASRQSFDFPFESATEFRRPALRYQTDYVWRGQRLTGGYEWERETNPLTPGFALANHSGFLQQQFASGTRWFATAGARVDRRDSYDTFVSPRISLGGFLVPHRRGAVSSLKVTGNLGRGIKTPTFAERFGGSFADASPGLKVERARTADVGLEVTLADARLRGAVTYFANRYTDQVAFRSGVVGDGVPEFLNIDGSRADGWEIEWALQRPARGVTASAGYTLLDSRVVTNLSTSQQFQPGQPLLRRPRHSGTVRAAWAFGPGLVFATLRLVGARHDNSFLSLRTVPTAARPMPVTTDITVNPGYAVMGLGAEWRLRHSSLFVRGDNVTDTSYADVLGYPGLPRSLTVGLRMDLGLGR